MATREREPLNEPDPEPKADIASLIDVSFLLLIYFLVTSTLQKRETDLGMVLPSNVPASTAEFTIDPMPITIDPQGQILIRDELVEEANDNRELPNLLDRLRSYHTLAEASGEKPIVIISADDTAKQQRFIDVVNVLSEVGITSVTITGFRNPSS
ncbi:hypothetical protein BH23VER1_BH23VER1_35360 [soil metagenome]